MQQTVHGSEFPQETRKESCTAIDYGERNKSNFLCTTIFQIILAMCVRKKFKKFQRQKYKSVILDPQRSKGCTDFAITVFFYKHVSGSKVAPVFTYNAFYDR